MIVHSVVLMRCPRAPAIAAGPGGTVAGWATQAEQCAGAAPEPSRRRSGGRPRETTAGVSLSSIQRQLGHAHHATTQRVYGRLGGGPPLGGRFQGRGRDLRLGAARDATHCPIPRVARQHARVAAVVGGPVVRCHAHRPADAWALDTAAAGGAAGAGWCSSRGALGVSARGQRTLCASVAFFQISLMLRCCAGLSAGSTWAPAFGPSGATERRMPAPAPTPIATRSPSLRCSAAERGRPDAHSSGVAQTCRTRTSAGPLSCPSTDWQRRRDRPGRPEQRTSLRRSRVDARARPDPAWPTPRREGRREAWRLA
jgi:hypothetical protein